MIDIPVLTEKKGSIISVKSPIVGIYDMMPAVNSPVSEHSSLGRIRNLHTEFRLVFAAPVRGQIIGISHSDKMAKVQYGEELFQLETKAANVTSKKDLSPRKRGHQPEIKDGHTIRAFTTGIFYLTSSPESPPFVTEGQIILKGKVMGLIEVMKTFNQIIFQGIEGKDSSEWKIKEIFPRNGEEVKLGDPLFLLEETSKQPQKGDRHVNKL